MKYRIKIIIRFLFTIVTRMKQSTYREILFIKISNNWERVHILQQVLFRYFKSPSSRTEGVRKSILILN